MLRERRDCLWALWRNGGGLSSWCLGERRSVEPRAHVSGALRSAALSRANSVACSVPPQGPGPKSPFRLRVTRVDWGCRTRPPRPESFSSSATIGDRGERGGGCSTLGRKTADASRTRFFWAFRDHILPIFFCDAAIFCGAMCHEHSDNSNSYSIIQRRAPPPTHPVAAPHHPEAATKGRRRAQERRPPWRGGAGTPAPPTARSCTASRAS